MLVVKYNVKFDNIGGKIFIREKVITPEEIEIEATKGNVACQDFIFRRDDFYRLRKLCYYGKIKKNRRSKKYQKSKRDK